MTRLTVTVEAAAAAAAAAAVGGGAEESESDSYGSTLEGETEWLRWSGHGRLDDFRRFINASTASSPHPMACLADTQKTVHNPQGNHHAQLPHPSLPLLPRRPCSLDADKGGPPPPGKPKIEDCPAFDPSSKAPPSPTFPSNHPALKVDIPKPNLPAAAAAARASTRAQWRHPTSISPAMTQTMYPRRALPFAIVGRV